MENYYKLIKFSKKRNFVKVQNLKKNRVEVYKLRIPKKSPSIKSQVKNYVYDKKRSFNDSNIKPKKDKRKYLFLSKSLFSVYTKYKNYSFLSKNEFLSDYVAFKFYRQYGVGNPARLMVASEGSDNAFSISSDFDKAIGVKSKNIFKKNYISSLGLFFEKQKHMKKLTCDVIHIYVVLRQNNIFVTITQNNSKTLKVFSSGSLGMPKSERKRSPTFFAVIKKTLYFLRPYIQASGKNKNLFRLIFKGFKRFRRPLINRFLFNKKFKSNCIGISNLDFESFNGCRKPKAKRIKIKNKKKKNKSI